MPTRPIAALLAAYTVVVVSGAPLPLAWVATRVAPPVAEDAERFPCEACPCGCGTAAHCWSNCCCHTLAERLAWARRESVRPPETALDDAQRAGLDVSLWRGGSLRLGEKPLPAAPTQESALAELDTLPPCCRKAKLATLTCCDSNAGASTCDSARPTPAPGTPFKQPTKKPTPGVALLRAMACQGIAEAWLSLGLAPIPVAAAVVTVEVSAPACVCVAPYSPRLDEAPTPPPPERGAPVIG